MFEIAELQREFAVLKSRVDTQDIIALLRNELDKAYKGKVQKTAINPEEF